MAKARPFLLLFATAFLFSASCGFSNDAPGDKGVLNYSIYTDYDSNNTNLKTALLVGDVTLTIGVSIIKYTDGVSFPTITHLTVPSEGVTITPDTEKCKGADPKALCVPNLIIKVTKPGAYKIYSNSGSNTVDTITIHFQTADTIKPIVKTREPYKLEFQEISIDQQPVSVVQGTQVVFIPIAMNGTTRLVGNIPCIYAADPKSAVVPGRNVGREYENGSLYVQGQENYYFIELGNVNFTISNTEMKTSGVVKFTVTPMPH